MTVLGVPLAVVNCALTNQMSGGECPEKADDMMASRTPGITTASWFEYGEFGLVRPETVPLRRAGDLGSDAKV